MYRAAYPTATEADEKHEMAYAKDGYNLFGQNGSSKEPHIVRLAGVWVSAEVARTFAEAYGMRTVIETMIVADPNEATTPARRSTKSTPRKGAADAAAAAVAVSPVTPTTQPPASKKRKEASPAVSSSGKAGTPTRRSTRAKSPPPAYTPQTIASVITASPGRKGRKSAAASQAQALQEAPTATTIDEDTQYIAETTGPEMEQDIAEQKSLIASLKAQRGTGDTTVVTQKRVREDDDEAEPLKFNFSDPQEVAMKAERAIATNKRVYFTPRVRRAAWGGAAFAVGAIAV